MRCNQAVMSAFLVHPKYRGYIASTDLLHTAGIEAARFAEEGTARAIIGLHTNDLVADQLKSGLWKQPSRGKKPHQYAVSYGVLSAIRQADMLAEIGTGTLPLRYDPYPPFAKIDDRHGVLVRRMFGRMLPDDESLMELLIQGITEEQRADRSWDGTIVATTLHIQYLLELGVKADHPAIAKGSAWLLSQYRDQLERQGIYVQGLFSSDDAAAELLSAQKLMPEAIPVFACYGVLPLIPTGLALRTLVATGHIDDPRVEASYASLLRIAIPTDDDVNPAIKGWCAHSCRNLMLDSAKIKRKKVSSV